MATPESQLLNVEQVTTSVDEATAATLATKSSQSFSIIMQRKRGHRWKAKRTACCSYYLA